MLYIFQVVLLTQLEETMEKPESPLQLDLEEPFANLAVTGKTVQEAREKLESLCISLGLETPDSLHPLLKDFVTND